MARTTDPAAGLASFASQLAGQNQLFGVSGFLLPILYPVFIAGCIAIMLSTVDALASAIGFTAFMDFARHPAQESLRKARSWTIGIGFASLFLLPLYMTANITDFLYTAYSAQLALLIPVLLALYKRRLDSRAALLSIWSGLTTAFVTAGVAARSADPELSVLPPITTVVVSACIYGLVYYMRVRGRNRVAT
jgi:Na+(H+)/acetate symporter ActP